MAPGHRPTQEEILAELPPEWRDLKTPAYDPRFPNTNQTRNCHTNYVDFQRCAKVRGADYEACQYFKRVYKALCPNDWIEKWDDQIATGRFPMKI